MRDKKPRAAFRRLGREIRYALITWMAGRIVSLIPDGDVATLEAVRPLLVRMSQRIGDEA